MPAVQGNLRVIPQPLDPEDFPELELLDYLEVVLPLPLFISFAEAQLNALAFIHDLEVPDILGRDLAKWLGRFSKDIDNGLPILVDSDQLNKQLMSQNGHDLLHQETFLSFKGSSCLGIILLVADGFREESWGEFTRLRTD